MNISRNLKINSLGIYRLPVGNLQVFSDEFFQILQINNLISGKTIIGGDLNFCTLKSEVCQSTNNIVNSFYESSFYPTIHIPTRITNHSSSLIDHFWFNLIFKSESGVLISDISDRYPIFTFIDLPVVSNQINKINVKFRDFSDKNKVIFSNMLLNEPWNELLNEDINLTKNKFLDTTNRLYNRCFPIKFKFISLKRLNSPWLTHHWFTNINKSLKTNFINLSNVICTVNYIIQDTVTSYLI